MQSQRLLSNVLSAQVSAVEHKPVDPSIRSELLNSIKGIVCSRGDQRSEFIFLHSSTARMCCIALSCTPRYLTEMLLFEPLCWLGRLM